MENSCPISLVHCLAHGAQILEYSHGPDQTPEKSRRWEESRIGKISASNASCSVKEKIFLFSFDVRQ
jgi:hypothetical protein